MPQEKTDLEILFSIESKLAKVEAMRAELARLNAELRAATAITRDIRRADAAEARQIARATEERFRAAVRAARSRG